MYFFLKLPTGEKFTGEDTDIAAELAVSCIQQSSRYSDISKTVPSSFSYYDFHLSLLLYIGMEAESQNKIVFPYSTRINQ